MRNLCLDISVKFALFLFPKNSNQVGIYLPCYDIFRNFMEDFTSRNAPSLTPYVPLVAGSVARSLACITCYPVELARTRMQVTCFIMCILCNFFVFYFLFLRMVGGVPVIYSNKGMNCRSFEDGNLNFNFIHDFLGYI